MEWQNVWEGHSDQTPNIYLEGGRLYRITFQTPQPSPDWLNSAIFNALTTIGLDVRGVGAGQSEIVITFWI